MRRALWLGLLWALPLSAADAPAFYDARSSIAQASAAEGRGDHAAAIRQLSQLLVRDDLSVEDRALACLQRGVAHTNRASFDEAISDFSRAISLQPQLAAAYFARARVYSDVGRYTEALQDFDRLEPQAAAFPDYYYFRGYVRFENRAYEAALADLDKAVAQTPGRSAVLYQRAKTRAALAQHEAALADFAAVQSMHSPDATLSRSAQRWHGVLAQALGRSRDALADFNALWAGDASDADAGMRRAYAAYAAGDNAAAVSVTSAVLRLESTTGDVAPWPGVVDPGAVFPDRIVEQYNALMRAGARDPYAHVLRARAQLKLGQRAAAIKDYQTALQAIPAGADPAVVAELEQARR